MKQIHITIVCLALGSCLLGLGLELGACGGSTPATTTTSATELCATAVALSPEVREQAAKLQREPLAFARELCAAVVLAAQVVKANVAAPEPAVAGAPAKPMSSPVGAAGSP